MTTHAWISLVFLTVFLSAVIACQCAISSEMPAVEVEEIVYRFEAANNGAGPMWCFGNTCIVRSGQQVFVSGLHTIPGAKPLNNCMPSLLRRDAEGWTTVYESTERTREPSPLAIFPGQHVFLSHNPSTAPIDSYAGLCRPTILQFDVRAAQTPPQRLEPRWQGTPAFTEHSYRSLAVDTARQEMVLFQNIDYTHAEWSLRDTTGNWSAAGKLPWPEDTGGKPIRVCYPTVALHQRRLFFCGVMDIVEPNPEWLRYKRELTGREWDYVFRRLFFTWSDDIAHDPFHAWKELASRDDTAGALFPNDLVVQPNGDVSVVWSESAMDARLKPKFFPGARQRTSLEYAMIRNGEVIHRRSLLAHHEGDPGWVPGRGRFHVSPDGRLWVLCYAQDTSARSGPQNLLLRIEPDGTLAGQWTVPLQRPLSSFYTNNVRAGCQPSNTIDVLGQDGNTMRYVRIRLPSTANTQ